MIKKHDICRVASLEPLAKDTYALTLKVNGDMLKYFRPGQFAHIRLPHAGEYLLRRPISVNTIDREAETMRFAFLIQGEGTRRLSQCRPGDELDILAPLGQGFKVKESHQKIWLVGGGIGIAPLLSLRDTVPGREYTAFLGYKSREYAYERKEFEGFCKAVHVTSDDGSIGEKNFVTEALRRELEKEKPDVILSCGPLPMFRSLKRVWEEDGKNVETQVSMEQHMGCGTGGCYTCTCMVAGAMKRVCMDGPVFDIREVEL